MRKNEQHTTNSKLGVFLSLSLVFACFSSYSVVYTSVANGNWNVTTNWFPNGDPGAGDDVIIVGGFKINANQNRTVNSIVIGDENSRNNELQINNGRTITTSSIDLIPGNNVANGVNYLDVRNGAVVVNGNITNSIAGTGNGKDVSIDVRDGTLTVTGNIDLNRNRVRSDINFVNNAQGVINVTGTVTVGLLRMRTSAGAAATTFTASSLTTGNGASILCNHSGAGTHGGSAQLNMPIVLRGNISFNVTGDGDNATEDLIVNGVISQATGSRVLTKVGAGSLSLNAANTFTNDVRLNAGQLNINDPQALGAGNATAPLQIANGTTIDNTSMGAITITRPVAMDYEINGSFTFVGSNDLNFGTAPVAIGADLTITTSANTLTMGGVVSGATFDLTKAGAGSLDFGSNNVTLADFTISAGDLSPPTAGAVLSLTGNLTNNSTLNVTTGAIDFAGAGTQVVSGSGAITIYDVENSGGGVVELNTAITVNNQLTMTSGEFNLDGNTLTLGVSLAAPGTLIHAENLASGILYDGTFTRFVPASTFTDASLVGFFPMGTNGGKFRPLYINATTASDGGSISVTHNEANHKDPTATVSIADGGSTIGVRNNASWTIATAGISAGVYGVGIGGSGFGAINAITDLRTMLSGSVVGTAGTNSGAPGNVLVKRTGLSTAELANGFYIGSIDATDSQLPVELAFFELEQLQMGTQLTWATLSEVNNDYFIVLRSTNGHDFKEIGTVKGKGNYIGRTNYHFQDFSETHSATVYYRLKQVDFDGGSELSEVLFHSNNQKELGVDQLVSCTNLVKRGSNLKILATNQDIIITSVHLYSMGGKLVYSKRDLNTNRMVVNMRSLPSNIYICKISLEGGRVLFKKVALR